METLIHINYSNIRTQNYILKNMFSSFFICEGKTPFVKYVQYKYRAPMLTFFAAINHLVHIKMPECVLKKQLYVVV